MWFAFNILSLTYRSQQYKVVVIAEAVVICFQYFIFDIPLTTQTERDYLVVLLWFAFNILSLTYRSQLKQKIIALLEGCDLLSIFYLWHTAHNKCFKISIVELVVICFQYFIFDIPLTTMRNSLHSLSLLWFAFNILSLTYRSQPSYIYT